MSIYWRKWVKNPLSCSSIWKSMSVCFSLSTFNNWADYMKQVFALKGNNGWIYLFVIVASIIYNIYTVKLLTAFFIEAFRKIKIHHKDSSITEPEKEWVILQKEMMKYKPTIFQCQQYNKGLFKKKPVQEKILYFIKTKVFIIGYRVLIIFDLLALSLKFNDASIFYFNIINYIEFFFIFLFNICIILKIIAYRATYFRNEWNIFEFIIIIVNDIELIINIAINKLNEGNRNILSIVQIFITLFDCIVRVLRLIIFSDFSKNITKIFIRILFNIVYIFLIIAIVIITFSCIGNNLFGYLPYRKYINRNFNFNSFSNSLFTLVNIVFGGDWNEVMNEMAYHDCRNPLSSEYQNDYYCAKYNVICFDEVYINHTYVYNIKENKEIFGKDYFLNTLPENDPKAYHLFCGSDNSYVFIIVYIILAPLLLLSLLASFIFEFYEESLKKQKDEEKGLFMNDFVRLWCFYDYSCKLLINPQEFILLFKELTPPFGLNYDRLISSNPLQFENKRNQFNIFKTYIEENKIDRVHLHYNDRKFNEKYGNILPYGYQFKNLFISKNLHFFTDELEILRLLNYLKLLASEDLTYFFSEHENSYIFENEIIGKLEFDFDDYKNYYIHFVEACITLSRYAISKQEGVNFSQLRENVTNSYTINQWIKKLNTCDVMKLFFIKEIPDNVNYKIFHKLAKLIMKKIVFLFKKKKNKSTFFRKERKKQEIEKIKRKAGLKKRGIRDELWFPQHEEKKTKVLMNNIKRRNYFAISNDQN